MNHRGVGLTELMLTNLPFGRCTIIVPSREAGNEIDARLKDAGRDKGTWRTMVIRNHSDVQQMAGLSEPVFFDHAFFDCGPKNPRAIKDAVETAIVSSRMAKWKVDAALGEFLATSGSVEPNTDAATAKEQPLAANDSARPSDVIVLAAPGTREYGILLGRVAQTCGGYARAVDCGIITPDDARFANGLPPLKVAA